MKKTAPASLGLAFALAGLASAAAPLAGCGGGGAGGAGGGPTCFDYTAFDGSTPAVAFQADVLPVFRTSCGLSTSCHGSQISQRNYLGPKLMDVVTPSDIAAIFDQNVGVPAAKDPTLSLVEPGDPEHSFLMHKLDGTLGCAVLGCSAQATCGQTMPQNSDLLPTDDRDTIRRWIAQGAKND